MCLAIKSTARFALGRGAEMSEHVRPQSRSVQLLLQLLSAEDRDAYLEMAHRFQVSLATHRHSGVKEFEQQLQTVHSFIMRSNKDQSKRSMICGVFFGGGFILVNTARFKDLLARSKSGMNNCFQKMSYDVMRPSNEIVTLFKRLLPDVDQGTFNLNQWCVRIETEESMTKFPPTIPDSVARTFEIERIPAQRIGWVADQPPRPVQTPHGDPEVIFAVKSLLKS